MKHGCRVLPLHTYDELLALVEDEGVRLTDADLVQFAGRYGPGELLWFSSPALTVPANHDIHPFAQILPLKMTKINKFNVVAGFGRVEERDGLELSQVGSSGGTLRGFFGAALTPRDVKFVDFCYSEGRFLRNPYFSQRERG